MKIFLIVLLVAAWIGSFFVSPVLGFTLTGAFVWGWFCWNFPVAGMILSILNLMSD